MQNYETNDKITYIFIDETKFSQEELDFGKKLVNMLCSKSDYTDIDISNISLAFQMQEGLKNPYFQEYFNMILDYSGIVDRDSWEEVVNSELVDYEGLATLFYNKTVSVKLLNIGREYWVRRMYAQKHMNYVLFDYSFCQPVEIKIDLGFYTKKLLFNINKSVAKELTFTGNIDLSECMDALHNFLEVYSGYAFKMAYAQKIKEYYKHSFENLSNFLLGFGKVKYAFFQRLTLDCKDIKDISPEIYLFDNCILRYTDFFNKKIKFVSFSDCIFDDDTNRVNVFTPKFNLSSNCATPVKVGHSFYDFLSIDFENDIKINIRGKSTCLQIFSKEYFNFTLYFLRKLNPKNKIEILIYTSSIPVIDIKCVQIIKNALFHNKKVFVYLDEI